MKTMSVFQPVMNVDQLKEKEVKAILDSFEARLNQINDWVLKYPEKDVSSIKFTSAIGALVKFNVAEACEFIICHNERHMQQINNTLEKLNA